MSYENPNVLTSGASFATFQQNGASGLLELIIAANAAGTSPPTVAATLSSNAGGTAGGLLTPGVYYVEFHGDQWTWRDDRLG